MSGAEAGRRRPAGFSPLQVGLHWLVAVLVVFQLVVHDGMEAAYDARMDGEPVQSLPWALLHIGVGTAVLLLAALRLAIRLTRGVPPVAAANPLLGVLSHAAHFLLYGFLFAMPLTGLVAWFGRIDASAELHELGRLVLVPLIGLHALGALVEHFVFRTDTLMRMLRPERS